MAHTSYKESYKESESATRHWRTRSSTEPDNRHSSFLQRWQESRMGPARILLVGIVIVVLAVSLVTPVRTYFQQRTEKASLQAENAQLEKEIKRKEDQLAVQNDPKTIEEQARQRLLLVPRGETGFRVILPGKKEKDNAQQRDEDVSPLSLNGTGPWYHDLWRSISVPEPVDKNSQ